MFNLYTKSSSKKVILYFLASLLLIGGVIVLYIFKLINETVFTIGLFVLLMISSTFTSTLIQRRVQKRIENKKKGILYTVLHEVEFNNPLKRIKTNYGKVDLFLEDKCLYSLITVRDVEAFFSEDQQQVKFNVDQKKYDKLVQFYIFNVKDSSLFRKISILNYQAKNFYVGSFILDDINKEIYQTDYIEPNDEYKGLYENFIKLLSLEKKAQ